MYSLDGWVVKWVVGFFEVSYKWNSAIITLVELVQNFKQTCTSQVDGHTISQTFNLSVVLLIIVIKTLLVRHFDKDVWEGKSSYQLEHTNESVNLGQTSAAVSESLATTRRWSETSRKGKWVRRNPSFLLLYQRSFYKMPQRDPIYQFLICAT